MFVRLRGVGWGLRGPGKAGECEGDVGKIIDEMLGKVAMLKGDVDEKGAEGKDESNIGTGKRVRVRFRHSIMKICRTC